MTPRLAAFPSPRDLLVQALQQGPLAVIRNGDARGADHLVAIGDAEPEPLALRGLLTSQRRMGRVR